MRAFVAIGVVSIAALWMTGCSSAPSSASVRPSAEQDPKLASVEFGLVSLGEVAWDGFTMPVVARDGSAMAVQADSVPDWATRLGTTDAPKRKAGTVTIYPIEPSGLGLPRTQGPDLLLGRAWINREGGGAIVEEPQPGGARRIGVMSPSDGAVQWLLEDGATNTDAWVEDHGDGIVMIWCRRAAGARSWSVEQAAFEWVRCSWLPRADGAGPSIAATDGVEWSGPCMIDGVLTVIQIRDGVLRAMAFDASPARSEPTMLRSALLSMRGTREVAWQCVSAIGPTCTTGSTALLYHPRFSRLASWSPRSDEAPTLLPEGTIGMLQCGEHCVWSSSDRVWACSGPRADATKRVLVAEGTWIVLQSQGRTAMLARPIGRSLRIYRLTIAPPRGG
ncbi:MAG: hypothetical protein FJ254_03110 [Phycisphaerae bacterium]|nr:hypothetical protein [Phycisphaerae bacterium]